MNKPDLLICFAAKIGEFDAKTALAERIME
jgi:hypothetical protein